MEPRHDERCSKTTARSLLNIMQDIRKDFPNLDEKNRGKPLVYLDSAATSLTPQQVINSESEYYEKFGGSIHRSVYELGEKATNAFENSRNNIAKFIGASKKTIIFTKSATESINLVAESWGFYNLKKGDVIPVSYTHLTLPTILPV